MDKLLYSPSEAAALVGVGRSTLYELIGSGAIESVRIGTLRRVPARALEEYVDRLREGRGGASAEPGVPVASAPAGPPADSR